MKFPPLFQRSRGNKILVKPIFPLPLSNWFPSSLQCTPSKRRVMHFIASFNSSTRLFNQTFLPAEC